MKNLLFPHQFQLIGWILFIPALITGTLICFGVLSLTGVAEHVVNDTVIISIALGALFIVCSKERNEDEMTRSIRLASLLNSLYVYVILLVACTIAINGIAFVWFAFINLGLFPIVFVCNFKLEMRRYNKLSDNE
jgi:cytochrome bd-type quinol oxidase subunit 2